jgi:hypothetical protein
MELHDPISSVMKCKGSNVWSVPSASCRNVITRVTGGHGPSQAQFIGCDKLETAKKHTVQLDLYGRRMSGVYGPN